MGTMSSCSRHSSRPTPKALQDALILSYHRLASDDSTFLHCFAWLFPFVSIPVFLSLLNLANWNQRASPPHPSPLLSVMNRLVFLHLRSCLLFFPLKRPMDINSTITERSVEFSPYSDPRSSLRLRGNRERNVLVVAEMLAFFGST